MARKAKAAKSGKQVVGLSRDDLLRIGVPSDWVPDVQAASEDRFFELASHLPAEAQEALLEFATTGALPSQEIPDFAASKLRVVRHSVLAERAFEFAEAPRSYEARENLGYSHPTRSGDSGPSRMSTISSAR
jgi:hypothetical protein